VERTGSFKGVYHVLGGVLSALDGVGPDQLTLAELVSRVQEGAARELIIALPATVDGQSTAHVIADRLHGLPVTITRLAHGMPIGGELDYLDDGTIATALKSRARV
jgi:recombination protein RecR